MKNLLLSVVLLLSTLCISSHAVVVKELEVKNNMRISKETISTYGNIKLNKDYSQEDLNLILKKLYETNFFSNISLSIEGEKLVLDIIENKIIQKVIVEGIKSSEMEKSILKNLFSKDKAPFLLEKVKNDQIRIRNSLNYLGYYI